MQNKIIGSRVVYVLLIVVAVVIGLITRVAVADRTDDQTLGVWLPLALSLGFALPSLLFYSLRVYGLDEWQPKTPLELSPTKIQRLRLVKTICLTSVALAIISLIAFILVPENAQARLSGAFLFSVGMLIMSVGARIVIRRQARFWAQGVVRGISPVLYGMLLMILGGMIALLGLAGLVLPFGFLKNL